MSSDMLYGRYNFADVKLRTFQGMPGVGHARIGVWLDFHHTTPSDAAPRPAPRIVHVSGAVHDVGTAQHLADLRPTSFAWHKVRTSDPVNLEGSVSMRALDLINARRKTPRDDVNLDVHVKLFIDGDQGWQESLITLRHRISASDWLTMLEGVGFSTMALIEVPTGGAAIPDGLAKAAERFRAAVAKLNVCDWDGAIADVREVFDAIEDVVRVTEPNVPWPDFANTATRQGWGFDQRVASIRMLVRNATHTAHHGGKGRAPSEARYIVGLAGLALKFYADKLRS